VHTVYHLLNFAYGQYGMYEWGLHLTFLIFMYAMKQYINITGIL